MLLNGKQLAEELKESLKARIIELPIPPRVAIVSIGDDAASKVYVQRKKKYGLEIGVDVGVVQLREDISFERALGEIERLNEDEHVHGIILQLPIPAHLDKEALVNSIDPTKDIDGLTARNMWRLMDDAQGIVPATARGIDTLLAHYDIALEGKHVVIVGDSLLVGKSTAIHFLNKNATVTVCHDKTKDLASYTKGADIVVTAVGKADLITEAHVHADQIIVDVGITKNGAGEIVGDVSKDVYDNVAAVTPVPGGVGPMTVASLFMNAVEVAEG